MGASIEQIGNPVKTCPRKKDPDIKKTRNILIKCKHRDCAPSAYIKTFDLVPDVKTFYVDESITVSWKGNDPVPPPALYLIPTKGKFVEGNPYVVPPSFFNDPTVIQDIYPDNYKSILDKKGEIELTVQFLKQIFTFSYKRKFSVAEFPWGSLDVAVYNPDKWKLKIKFPMSGKSVTKRGIKWDKELKADGANIKTTTYQNEKSDSSQSSETVDRDKTYSGRYQVKSTKTTTTDSSDGLKSTATDKTSSVKDLNQKREISSSDTDIVFEKENEVLTVEHNGTLINASGLKIFFFVLNAIKYIKKIQKIFDDIPKMGAYIQSEITVLDGSISLAYGWKEYKDHRAFMKLQGKVNIVIYELNFEAGIGISGFTVKFQAFASVDGKFEFEGDVHRDEPYSDELLNEKGVSNLQRAGKFYSETSTHFSAKLTATLTGTVGARCEAFYFVKMDPKIEASLIGELALDLFNGDNLLEISTVAKFTGIKGSVEVSWGFSDAIGTEKSSKGLGKKVGDLAKKGQDKAGVDYKGDNKHGTEEAHERIFLNGSTFYQSRFPDDLHHISSHEDLDEDEIKIAVKEMLNGMYLNSGFFSSFSIRVMRDKQKLDWSDKVIYGVFDYIGMEEVDQDEVTEKLVSALMKEKHLDKEKKSIELLLLKIRNELTELQKDKSYIHINDLIHFIYNKLKSILKDNLDPAKVFESKFSHK